MNDRIKKLLVECGAVLSPGEYNGQVGTIIELPHGKMFDFERFTNTLIQDCVDVVVTSKNRRNIKLLAEEIKSQLGEKAICPLEKSFYLALCPLPGTLDPKKIKNFKRPDNPKDCPYFQDCTDWVAERKANGLNV